MDGLWDHKGTKTLTSTPKTAPVGIDGFGGVMIDDFMLWDGVILVDAASLPPDPGNEIKFVMRGFANTQYVAASSLGNISIPLPDGRIVPLAPDNMFMATAQNMLPSIFKNYVASWPATGTRPAASICRISRQWWASPSTRPSSTSAAAMS